MAVDFEPKRVPPPEAIVDQGGYLIYGVGRINKELVGPQQGDTSSESELEKSQDLQVVPVKSEPSPEEVGS